MSLDSQTCLSDSCGNTLPGAWVPAAHFSPRELGGPGLFSSEGPSILRLGPAIPVTKLCCRLQRRGQFGQLPGAHTGCSGAAKLLNGEDAARPPPAAASQEKNRQYLIGHDSDLYRICIWTCFSKFLLIIFGPCDESVVGRTR